MDTRIFCDYGIEIIKRSGKYYLRTDSGEMASRPIEAEISMADALLAQRNPETAYNVIMKYDKMGSFSNV